MNASPFISIAMVLCAKHEAITEIIKSNRYSISLCHHSFLVRMITIPIPRDKHRPTFELTNMIGSLPIMLIPAYMEYKQTPKIFKALIAVNRIPFVNSKDDGVFSFFVKEKPNDRKIAMSIGREIAGP